MKLNLGCGNKYMAGYVNVDMRTDVQSDMHCDLRCYPWPWDTESVGLVWMDQVLEHLSDTVRVIEEIHRILIPGGKFCGKVPFCGSVWAFQDPTHRAFFSDRSFVYFDRNRPAGTPKYSEAEFTEVRAWLESNSVSWMNKVRNAIPFRRVWRWWLWNMYDNVCFELVK